MSKLTGMKQSIACEDYSVIAILHVPADTVLSMAGSMESLDSNTSDLEAFSMGWSLGDSF